MNKELDISEFKARKLLKHICEYFEVEPCNCWFIYIHKSDPSAIGWYSRTRPNMAAYMMIERRWSRRLIIVLHEACHHIQSELYSEDISIHGQSFQLAKSRMSTYARKHISDHYDWGYMIQRHSEGKIKCKKKKKK